MEAIEQSHSNEECIKFKKKLKKWIFFSK
jgi:hypothetical protein